MIQGPEENDIETAPRCFSQHRLKLCTVGSAAGLMVFVLTDDSPALCAAKISELAGLIFSFLAFVFSGDARIKSGSHAAPRASPTSDRGGQTMSRMMHLPRVYRDCSNTVPTVADCQSIHLMLRQIPASLILEL